MERWSLFTATNWTPELTSLSSLLVIYAISQGSVRLQRHLANLTAAVVFITTDTAMYSVGHGLHTLTAKIDSAFHPPWDGK